LLLKGERTLVIDFGAIYRYFGLWKEEDSSSEGEELKGYDEMNKICEWKHQLFPAFFNKSDLSYPKEVVVNCKAYSNKSR